MGKVNIVTLAAMSPLWFGLVTNEDHCYSISPMPLDAVVGVPKGLLDDAMLIFGDTEESIQLAVDNAFPGFEKKSLKTRQSGHK